MPLIDIIQDKLYGSEMIMTADDVLGQLSGVRVDAVNGTKDVRLRIFDNVTRERVVDEAFRVGTQASVDLVSLAILRTTVLRTRPRDGSLQLQPDLPNYQFLEEVG